VSVDIPISNENTNAMELSIGNKVSRYNLQTDEENAELTVDGNDKTVSV